MIGCEKWEENGHDENGHHTNSKVLVLNIIRRSGKALAVDGNNLRIAFALSDGLCEEFDF